MMAMKYLVVKLKPRSFLHLGTREGWLEGSKITISSDTLFSALCHCHLLLYGEVDSFLEAFKGDSPPFLLSSAFPYWKDDFYFPLPKNQLVRDKELKKIKFVNLPLLQKLLRGARLEELKDKLLGNSELKTLPDMGRKAKKNGKEEKSVPWTVDDVPRVSLSRFNNHPGENFFYFGQVGFDEDAGLFVMVRILNSGWEGKVKSLFRLLSDEGVGGDRTSGKGLFRQPEFLTLSIEEAENADGVYAASAYFPAENERLELEKSFYELEERGGYIFSPKNRALRKRSLRMFVEGSVFAGGEPVGSLCDITPEVFHEHRVYRYGFVFPIGCRLEEP